MISFEVAAGVKWSVTDDRSDFLDDEEPGRKVDPKIGTVGMVLISSVIGTGGIVHQRSRLLSSGREPSKRED